MTAMPMEWPMFMKVKRLKWEILPDGMLVLLQINLNLKI